MKITIVCCKHDLHLGLLLFADDDYKIFHSSGIFLDVRRRGWFLLKLSFA